MRKSKVARSVVLGIMLSTTIAMPVVYGDTAITTTGTYEVGDTNAIRVNLSAPGEVIINNANVTNNSSTALFTTGSNNTVTVKNFVSSTSNEQYGIWNSFGATVNISGKGNSITTGGTGVGHQSLYIGYWNHPEGKATVNILEDAELTLNISHDGSIELESASEYNNNGKVTINLGSTDNSGWGGIGSFGGTAIAGKDSETIINMSGISKTYSGIYLTGMSGFPSSYTSRGKLVINSTTPMANGIYINMIYSSTQASTFTSEQGSSTIIDLAKGNGILSEGKYATGNLDNANITVKDGVGVNATKQSTINIAAATIAAPTAVSVGDDTSSKATVNINQAGGRDVKITGNLLGTGRKTGSVINANLDTANSYLTGMTNSDEQNINLTLNNAALWNVTGDSNLTALTAANNGNVNMNYTGLGNYETVTTTDFTGNNGIITFTTDLQASKNSYKVTQNSDKLVIAGSSSGTAYVTVHDESKANTLAAEGYLLLVEDKTSGGATFVGKALNDFGIFKYKPIITDVNPEDNTDVENAAQYTGYDNTNAKNWYLTGFEVEEVPDDPVAPIQPAAVPSLASHAERYVSYWRQLDNLNLRLGELRDNENSEGIWARVKTARESIDNIGLANDHWTMYQLGYDHKYKEDANHGKKYWGMALDYTSGKEEYAKGGRGESGTTSLSLYNTWLGNKGHYLDLVAKAGRMGRDYTYEGEFPDSGESHNWYYSLSTEYGRKIVNKNSGWYWEPETQLTFGHVNGVNYTTDQGIQVHNGAFNSLVWRLGMNLGKKFGDSKTGKASNIYVKAYWNKEILGDLDYSLNYETQHLSDSDNYGGTWWTVGVGANTQVGTKTNAYLDVSKNFGGDIARKWQFNVGFRWNWDKA